MSDALPQKRLITPVPVNETERLSALHRYRVLDTPPEVAFDRITRLAARLFDMPTALISLVDESRIWFKSGVGFEAREVPRDTGLWSFAGLRDEPLIIPDARLDDRFACNPFVLGELGIRFYACAPLISHEGFNLGTLCLLDTQPRDPLSAEQQATLVDLAAMVVDVLELQLAADLIAQVDVARLEITPEVVALTSAELEHQQTEATLRESEARYRKLFESIDEGFCICEMLFDENGASHDYRFLEVNPVFEKLTGLEQATGKTVRELIRDLEAFWFEIYDKVVQTGEPVRFEQQSVMMNRWFDVKAFWIGEPHSHQFGVLFTNISDRKQAEQQRERFLAVGSDLQVIMGDNGYFQWVSPTFERSLGWTLDEMTSHPWTEFVHADDISASVSETESLFCSNETFKFENRYRHKDGSYRWFLWKAQLYLEERVIYGAAVDITERKQAEAQLRAIYDGTHEYIGLLTPEGMLLKANRASLEFSGTQREQVIGLPFWEAVWFQYTPDTPETVRQAIVRAAAGEFIRFEAPIINSVGETMTFELSFYPIRNETGEVILIVPEGRDITDRKQTEQALHESEEQSRNILESITDAFFALDENWRFTYVNGAAEMLLDRAPSDLIGKSFWEEYPGLNGSEFEQLHRRVMRDRLAGSLTAFYPDHDRWYEVRTYPSANGVTIYFRNVTAQMQAEEAVRLSESRFRRIFECNMIGMGIWTRSGGIIDANDALLDMIGYTRQDLDAGLLNWQEITAPEHAWRDEQALAEIAVKGTCSSYEKDYIHKQGRRIPILVGAAAFAGTLDAGVFFTVDITDRQQAEATVQASNERLKLLSTIANDLLLNKDSKAFLASLFAQVSTHLGLEVYFNYLFKEDLQCLQLYTYGGISDEMAESAKVLELGQGVCGYAVQHRQPAVVEDALESDRSLALPLQSIGLRAYASHPLIVGDRVLGTLGLGTRQRDRFTDDELDLMQAVANQVAAALERSRLVAELEARAEALTQTNRIKDEFLAVLSHELRSPLNPILGWTRLLQNGKLNLPQQTEALKTIERNAKLQTQLIEDLLDISRIMQGKLTLTVAPVSLTFVISAALETVRLAAQARNIQILLDLSTTVSHVFGDATRLQQVVWNLLTNAVKFTPQGGQVTVELRQLDQLAQIRVSDTGKGIDPQFLPHVFEYFRQADSTTTRRFGGLGLGLAIVRQIVEMHGGTVKAESLGEDQGAIFTVQLPLIEQTVPIIAEPVQAKAEKAENPLSNLQILVVDDDVDTREFQAFLLEQSGARVIAVASGLEALQVLERSIPDLLISDVGMAEMDGYMLIRQIRSRPPDQGGTIRALAVTAYARDFDQQKALQSGFQGHITKPVEPEILVKAIVDLLDRN